MLGVARSFSLHTIFTRIHIYHIYTMPCTFLWIPLCGYPRCSLLLHQVYIVSSPDNLKPLVVVCRIVPCDYSHTLCILVVELDVHLVWLHCFLQCDTRVVFI